MIIDYVEQLEISDKEVARHLNELRYLECLATGLNHLYSQVSEIECRIRQTLPENQTNYLLGNAPQLNEVPQDLVACFFHWYSVTACNYVQLVGWLGNGGDTGKAKSYLNKVLPEVSLWRNKVGAHFALVDPKERGDSKDSEADLAKSVMTPVAFQEDAFYTDTFQLRISHRNSDQGRTRGKADWWWSLRRSVPDTVSSNHKMG